MQHYDTVAQFFHQHIEHLSLSVDAIADVASNTATRAAQTIFSEGKVMVCGAGADAAAAILLTDLLRSGVERERPVLPVVELCARHTQPLDGGVQWMSQQIAALGQPGDFAIVFASTLGTHQLDLLANAFLKRQVDAVWIGLQGPGLSLTFPGADASTALTLSTASAVCLATLIDINTFGPMEDSPL